MKSKKLVHVAMIVLAGSSLLLFGCGQPPAAKPVAAAAPSPNQLTTLPQGTPVPTTDISGIPGAAFTAMQGTYTGNALTQIPGCDGSNCYNKHTYTMVLGKGTIQGQNLTYPVVTFLIDNQQMFQTAAQIGAPVAYNGMSYYPLFVRSNQGGDAFLNYSYGLEIMLAINTSSKVDSTQSAITIQDCGLSQACDRTSSDAYIASLAKQP